MCATTRSFRAYIIRNNPLILSRKINKNVLDRMLSSLASLFLARPGNNRGMRREIDEKRKARDRWRLLFLFSFFLFSAGGEK